MQYQGLDLLLKYISVNGLVLGALALSWLHFRKTEKWKASLAIHWLLFFWICVLCFPWLGEMI